MLFLAYVFKAGEDRDLSIMAYVELKKMFPNKKVKFSAALAFSTELLWQFTLVKIQVSKITEMNLSASQERATMEKKRLKWKAEGSIGSGTMVRGGAVDPSKLVVELGPMEIRTFLINFDVFSVLNKVQPWTDGEWLTLITNGF